MCAPHNPILQIACTTPDVPDTASFSQWVNLVLATTTLTGEITIRIVDTVESQMLNKQYRNKNKPTNVLSFPFENFPNITISENILGDLVLCAPVIIREAQEQGKPIISHWAHMTIHGLLHLLGYDHINEADAQKMETLEIDLLQQLGYKNPYEFNDKENGQFDD